MIAERRLRSAIGRDSLGPHHSGSPRRTAKDRGGSGHSRGPVRGREGRTLQIRSALMLVLAVVCGPGGVMAGQPYDPPDRGQPGDGMIQSYLARVAAELDAGFLDGMRTADDWAKR